MACTRCLLSNCPGPQACLVDCITCDDEKTIYCPDECDQGYFLNDRTGEFTIRCGRCNGKSRVRCPSC